MGSEWREITLADSLEFVVDNRGKTVPPSETGIPLIATNCVSNENLYPEHINVRYVTQDTFDTWFRAHPEPGDILLTNKGSKNGAVCLCPDHVGFCIAQDMVALRAKREAIDPLYLFAALRSSIVQYKIKQLNVDSVIPHFKKTDFDKLHIPLPSKKEQERIGEIHFQLCNKIELNRRMNATLEGMTQALFKSWFVDFDPVIDNALAAGNPIPEELAPRAEVRRQALSDGAANREAAKPFPAAFQENEELGWIPEGWEAKKIEDCISRFSAGKKYSQKTAEDGGCVPILDQGKSGIIGYHNDGPGVKASTDDPIIVFANHTCYMRLIQFDFSAIQNVLPYKGDGLNIYWIYEATKGRQDFLEYKGHWPDFVLNRIVVPTIDLVDAFGDVVEASYRKIYANTLENEGLTKIRDTLLPKLISGELLCSNVSDS